MSSNALSVQVFLSIAVVFQITTAVVVGWTIVHAIRHQIVLAEEDSSSRKIIAGRAIIWRSVSLFIITTTLLVSSVISVYESGSAFQIDVWRSFGILMTSIATHLAGLAEVYERVALNRMYERER